MIKQAITDREMLLDIIPIIPKGVREGKGQMRIQRTYSVNSKDLEIKEEVMREGLKIFSRISLEEVAVILNAKVHINKESLVL